MRIRKPLVVAAFFWLATTSLARATNAPRSFSLSTSRTFSPGESIKIQLMARNVPELEFRVYRVLDPQKFFAGLKDLHNFGTQNSSPAEQIDRRTWIERLHDFKADIWWRVRHFFRGQFTDDARDTFREEQTKLGKRSRVVGAAQFAQVPLLNPSQLVARWKLVTPPSLVSETQQLPIDGLGAGVYLIEATDGTYRAYTVAIVTNIAAVERANNGAASLYVADRKTGSPIEKAEVMLWTGAQTQSSGETDSDGMATLKFAAQNENQSAVPENVWIIARHGADVALVTPWAYTFSTSSAENSKAYIYTDRPVYRPGHTVHIKGIVRREKDDTLRLPEEKTIKLTVTAPEDKTIFDKEVPVSAHGTVAADVMLEADAALGYYTVELGGKTGSGNFYVEEYKKPEYQVTVKPAAQRVLQGNSIQATIEARYFFGEPVANAKVKYVVHTSQHYWWGEDESDENTEGGTAEGDGESSDDSDAGWDATQQQEQDGVLDANGRLAITLPTQIDGKHGDQDYRIEARVTDAANREVSGHATVLATYGSFRVSVEPTSYVFEGNKPVRVRVTAQDYDGKPVRTQVHVKAVLEKWDSVTHQRSEKQAAASDASTGADGATLVDLPIGGSGDFEVTASAPTPEHRTVESHTWVWIWNGAGQWYTANTQAQIIADKKTYKVGDTAHLLLVTGLKEAWAIVTVEGESVQSRRLMHATSQSFAFDVPITQKAQPNLIVDAVLVHDDQVISAQRSLKVPLVERTLTVTVTPDKTKYLPEEKSSFDVFAVDANGKPVEADLSFGEVDDALYSVRSDTTPDPVSYFYPTRSVFLNPQSSFEFFFSGEAGIKSPLLAQLSNGSGMFHPRMAQVKPGSDLVVPKVRKAFPDTAYWNPNVRTAVDGHARVEFNFPDALTTWRTTVRAMTDDGKAGSVVTRVLVRKNLIVRLAAPRFFRQGDETVLRVIAHNYLETPKNVTFALDVTGVEVIGGQSKTINIPAKGENFAEWRVKAGTIGNAVFTAKALTNEESDALEQTLPVLPYGVKQRAAGSGVVYSGSGQNQWAYRYPAGSDAAARKLTITVAPSVAGTVFSALDYLTSYPWGCTEQTMSSFLPDVIVAQAVDKLHLKSSIDRGELTKMVKAGMDRLNSFQHDDGGWGWWPDDPSRVFMTAYVVSGLGQAKSAGFSIDDERLNKGRTWLVNTLAAHREMIPDLRAYTVYALATTGGAPKATLDRALASRNKLSDEGLALVGLALDASGDNRAKEFAQLLEQRAKVSDVDAHWESSYDGLMEYWDDTSPETTAFALKLIARQDRASGLMPKAAQWLANHRDGDYWFSTKQTAMVIQGLTDYLALSGELNNSSDVEVLVNGTSVDKRHFGPGDGFAPPWRIQVPNAQAGNAGQVTIRKSGNGIAYWSAESGWYSADRKQFQQGKLSLNIARDYFLLQKKQDKPSDPITYDLVPLKGPVHIGDIVAVRMALNGTDWKYVLAEDPIPAGTEFLPDTGLYRLSSKPDWWADIFTRKEFHDDRAAFFDTEFNNRREYVYLLKVVNAGKFAISPAQAGPMYQSNVETSTDPAMLEVQP